nr:hypothetical protein BDOA9_0141590 [Bradyrhizobium sp. DOA9]
MASGFSVTSGNEDSKSEIENAHFFVLFVSDKSLASDRIQRQIGLACARQRGTEGYRPIVIQVFAREAHWRRLGTAPAFPVRDFDSGELSDLLALDPAFDELVYPAARSALIAFMRPTLLVTRCDIWNAETLNETEVFKLYAEFFPPKERDDPEDIAQWVLSTDVGTVRSFDLSGGGEISYQLDSRYFVLNVARRAIGLGFVTHDYRARLTYVNYVGLQRCWREGQLARTLFQEIVAVLADLFRDGEALILEVEPFDIDAVNATIERLKTNPEAVSQAELDEIRKILRIGFYQKLDFFLFVDAATGRPLPCRSPCVDPSNDPESWACEEADYWIMWRARSGDAPCSSGVAADWRRAIHCIYVEILLKSVVERGAFPAREHYWEYGNRIVERTIARTQGTTIELRQFPDRSWYDRWRALDIDLPI